MAADAAVTFLLEKVSGVITGYAELISGAAKEFKELQNDVKLLNTNLQDLSSASTKDHTVKEIQDQVRDVVYEVEDTIDSWLTRAAAVEDKGDKVKCFAKWFSPTHFGLANDVKTLREGRVKEIFDKILKMRSVVGTSKEEEAGVIDMDPPLRPAEKVVRLKDAESTIIKYLKTPQKKLDIIPIIGMPGLGKTTMAWKIYKDERTCKEFPLRIWVHFSQRFNSHDVFVKIMNQINQGNNDVSSMSNRDLSDIVRACLDGEKFLMVFDDVWEMKHWNVIKHALPYDNGRGKVMITSRNMEVGLSVQKYTEPYVQRPLDRNESWELLQYEVFGDLESCPEELQAFGPHIAHKKCKGVPLTILLMGGVLMHHYFKFKKSPDKVKRKWEEMAGSGNLALKDQEKAIDVVAMSYNSLPDHMRDCFLYLGVFPEGYEIPSWTLTSLWIAEGFIKPDYDKSLEEIAMDNLDELVSRNLLMALKRNSMQEVKVCGVHDMIRLFCRTEGSKQKLFQEKMLENQVPSDSEMDMIRRLCLHSDLPKFFDSNLRGQHVRSFLSFGKEVIDLGNEYNTVISERFGKLRILQSKYIKFSEFPKSVTNLIHLRYIVLCVDDLKVLPETISQLWNLQTIVIDTNSNFVKMEANIWKMNRLRHVKTKAAIVLNEKRDDAASESNLQILNRVSPESVTGDFSRKASKLVTLGIRGKLTQLFDNMSLKKLSNLEKLKLYHAATGNPLKSFPGHKRFPPKLKRLTLSNTSLDWEHMRTIASIGVLEVLKLKNNAFKGTSWKAVSHVFLSLQFLLIVNTDLVNWEASASSFPSLTHLVVKECKDLYEIPVCILQRLENLETDHVPVSTVDSADQF